MPPDHRPDRILSGLGILHPPPFRRPCGRRGPIPAEEEDVEEGVFSFRNPNVAPELPFPGDESLAEDFVSGRDEGAFRFVDTIEASIKTVESVDYPILDELLLEEEVLRPEALGLEHVFEGKPPLEGGPGVIGDWTAIDLGIVDGQDGLQYGREVDARAGRIGRDLERLRGGGDGVDGQLS